MKLQDWLRAFTRDKEWMASLSFPDAHDLQRIDSYRDQQGHVWEIGFTFTHRLVLRCGRPSPDGARLLWSDWETLHDVEVPPSP